MKEFYNDITYFLDKYSPRYKNFSDFMQNNYFVDFGLACDDENTHIYVFRLPGASRGQCFVDERTGKVTFIEAYGDFQITYPYSIPYDKLTRELQVFVGRSWSSLGYRER